MLSDAVGRHPKAYWGAYAVAKAGLEALMQVLADELSSAEVRVNSLDPGATRTALRTQAYPTEDPAHLKPPDAVAPFLLWLAGPESSGVSGRAFTFGDDPWESGPEGEPPAAA
jgi:NAD(P)-dependent dehydrogenase (short-subunit alcohol dehydrogenase family)